MSIKKREIKSPKTSSNLDESKVRHAVRSVHVYPGKDGRWEVKKSGAARSSRVFNSKRDAVRRARDIATRKNNGLVIHNRNGEVQFQDSHGHNPFPAKG